MKKLLVMLVVASAATGTAAGAQDLRSDAVACADTASAVGLYRRCALWMDGNRVRRGAEGAVAGRPGFFRPTPMSHLVAGDSALWHARQFERRERQSIVVTVLGGALIATGAAMLDTHRCSPSTFNSCAAEDRRDVTALSISLGGAGLALVGGIIHYTAGRSQARAVWWNNERFAR